MPSENFSAVVAEGFYMSLPLPAAPDPDEEDYPTPTSAGAGASSGAAGGCDAESDMPWCHRPPVTPPSSPLGGSRTWQPPQLVNYLWGQTSQLYMPPGVLSEKSLPCTSPGASADAVTHTPVTPMSHTSSAQGTPWNRGQWMPFPPAGPTACGGSSPKATRTIVRNTFIDIEVLTEGATPGQRSSRSLSPSFSPLSRTPVAHRSRLPSFQLDSAAPTVPEKSGASDQWNWYWH